MVSFDDNLDEDAYLDEDEERFLKRVRRLAVSLPGYYAKEVFVEATHETTSHAGAVLQAVLRVVRREIKAPHKTVLSDVFEV